MDIRLRVVQGPNAGQELPITGVRRYCIGNTADCQLRYPAEAVEAHHAILVQEGSSLELHDQGTPQGTYVNGERLSGARYLQTGDRLRMGQLEFEIVAYADAPAQATPAGSPYGDSPPATAQPYPAKQAAAPPQAPGPAPYSNPAPMPAQAPQPGVDPVPQVVAPAHGVAGTPRRGMSPAIVWTLAALLPVVGLVGWLANRWMTPPNVDVVRLEGELKHALERIKQLEGDSGDLKQQLSAQKSELSTKEELLRDKDSQLQELRSQNERLIEKTKLIDTWQKPDIVLYNSGLTTVGLKT